MNLKKRLRHLANISARDRGTGRSTVIARAAQAIGGTVIAQNMAEAKFITKVHLVPARSADVNHDGIIGPFLFDHHTVEALFNSAADKIETLERRIAELEKELKDERIWTGSIES
jgi:hypothetical protein